MNTTQIIKSGNRAVVIVIQDTDVWATLYVNSRNGLENAAATTTRWQGKAVAGAERWARKILGA